jgi:hypothetical protein
MCVKIVFFCLEGEDIYSMYYAYEHYKKDTDQIFYVGIGKIEEGKYQRAYSLAKRNPHWHATAKKYGFDYKIVFESESREEVCNKEIELILKYGRKDLGTGHLVNKTTGGEKTFKMSKDTILKILETKRKNGSMEIISQRARERMLTNNPWKGKTHDGFNKKEVYQYEASTGVFVEKYKSIKSATGAMGFSSDNVIGKCLRGENQTGGGYIWYYEYQGEKVDRIRRGIAKDQLQPVIEVDQYGNIINEWECISDAALAAGVTPSAVSQAIRKNSLCKGIKFKIKA